MDIVTDMLLAAVLVFVSALILALTFPDLELDITLSLAAFFLFFRIERVRKEIRRL